MSIIDEEGPTTSRYLYGKETENGCQKKKKKTSSGRAKVDSMVSLRIERRSSDETDGKRNMGGHGLIGVDPVILTPGEIEDLPSYVSDGLPIPHETTSKPDTVAIYYIHLQQVPKLTR